MSRCKCIEQLEKNFSKIHGWASVMVHAVEVRHDAPLKRPVKETWYSKGEAHHRIRTHTKKSFYLRSKFCCQCGKELTHDCA